MEFGYFAGLLNMHPSPLPSTEKPSDNSVGKVRL